MNPRETQRERKREILCSFEVKEKPQVGYVYKVVFSRRVFLERKKIQVGIFYISCFCIMVFLGQPFFLSLEREREI